MGNTVSAAGVPPASQLAARANHINHYSPLNLGGSWSQSRTNGESILGTLEAPTLPYFLTNNPTPNGFPWSTKNAFTNYYKDYPTTGVFRSYDFSVTRGTIAPDGYEISGLLVNGGYPGPTIEANWGDTIQVTVHNDVEDEGVSLHWHGFLQTRTPWEDGVPGISQCPIAPGKSFTYQFIAELYGTSWYHSHYSAQYAAGLVGPIVIHGPREHRDYDIDVGPILLSDWYHKPYFELVETIMAPNGPGIVFSDNNLINGKNNFNCSSLPTDDTTTCNSAAGLSKFVFKRGKVHRLRLINSGAEGLQHFSIDGHTLKVIAYDFVQIEPYETEVVTLGIGQRADVLVTANGKANAYWMRSNISSTCSLSNNPNALAAIYYNKADQTKQPQSTAWDVDVSSCSNDALSTTVPLMKLPLPNAELTYDFEVDLGRNASGVNLFSFDNVSFRTDYNSPTLLLAKLGEEDKFEKQWNVRNVGKAKSVRVNVINKTPIAHPMHLHGFNMYILNEGDGEWDGTIVNRNNPMRRDVIQVRPNGYVVIQFDAATNPGVWPFHCHIAWHVSAGFLIQFVTQPNQVKQYRIPNTVAQTCRDWGTWTKTNIPDQIDSGL